MLYAIAMGQIINLLIIKIDSKNSTHPAPVYATYY